MSRTLSLARVFRLTPLLFSSSLLGQSAWTKAPPLPRGCYSGPDTFQSEAAAVMSELEAAIEKQQQINRELADQVFNMDPATLQQRMMAAMQKDPARSQEIIEATQMMATTQCRGAQAEADAEGGDFEAKKAKLTADYQADRARIMSLYAQRTEAEMEAERRAATGHQGVTDPAVIAENNEKYRTVLCPKWFGTEVPALLASYRAYLEQRITKAAAAELESMRMPEMLGVSTKEFRPIAEMRGVVDYLRFASELYELRGSGPIVKDGGH